MTAFQKMLRSEVTWRTVSLSRRTLEEEVLEASSLGLFRCAICAVFIHIIVVEEMLIHAICVYVLVVC